ncbi:hypothetical protein [Sulfuricurvum sp.]|uniref:hypothetical protein n=1 Tax=Sulfuricurvum sp. TaxID=2025608 RepID=UPI003565F544
MTESIFDALKNKIKERRELHQEAVAEMSAAEKKTAEDNATALDGEITALVKEYILQPISSKED